MLRLKGVGGRKGIVASAFVVFQNKMCLCVGIRGRIQEFFKMSALTRAKRAIFFLLQPIKMLALPLHPFSHPCKIARDPLCTSFAPYPALIESITIQQNYLLNIVFTRIF